jgi:hypothetical protein
MTGIESNDVKKAEMTGGMKAEPMTEMTSVVEAESWALPSYHLSSLPS